MFSIPLGGFRRHWSLLLMWESSQQHVRGLAREEKPHLFDLGIWQSTGLVIEIVSNRQGNELGSKLRDYARMGVGYYVVFDPLQLLGATQLRAF